MPTQVVAEAGESLNPNPCTLQVPAGVLYVKLIEAVNVPNMDIFSKTDPFVKLFVRKRNERRSRTVFNSLHPRCLSVKQMQFCGESL